MAIESPVGQRNWFPSIGPERWNGSFEGCSKYYSWFCDLGYPNADLQQWNDGEWALIEFYNSPIIPSMTRWNFILSGMRNVDITRGFVTRFLHSLDLRKREVWEAAEARDKAQDEEKARLDRHAEETAEKAKNIIMNTPTLVERIAKNGLQEMNLHNIVKHVPRHQLREHNRARSKG